MSSNSNIFSIILNHARSFGGYEELVSITDFETWIGISETYSHVVVTLRDEEQVKIRVDWSSAIAYATKLKELYLQSSEGVARTLNANPDFFEHTIVCPATVQFKPPHDKVQPWYGDDYLRQLLYEIFLIANLSSPGCFNLYRSYIKVPSLDPEKDALAQTELQLSEYLFEEAWHATQDTPWLKVGFLPFHEVFHWYRRFGIELRQVAKTNVEKALFALLHLGRSSFLEPEATLWLASALEAVFDTPHGSSFQFLHKRISKLLSLDEKQQGVMKNRLREFYNVRNSFAHGGGAICHPIANEYWDPEINKVSERTIEANNFACAILLGSIQELIRRNVAGIGFDEIISDIRFQSDC